MTVRYFQNKRWADIPMDTNPAYDYVPNTFSRVEDALIVVKTPFSTGDQKNHHVIYIPYDGPSITVAQCLNYSIAEEVTKALLKMNEIPIYN